MTGAITKKTGGKKDGTEWGTGEELRFLKKLGTGRGKNRREALLNYQAAAQNRKAWGGINRAEVVRYVREELEGMG